MNATIIIFLIVVTLISGTALFLAYKLLYLMTIVICGLDEQLNTLRSIYRHNLYNTQATRFILTDLENRVSGMIDNALEKEDYENVMQYREIIKAISSMRKLSDEEIEDNQ